VTKLREKRLAYGLTQVELAARARVSSATIHYLEKDTNQWPTLTVARKLAGVFGMKPEVLFPHVKAKLGRPNSIIVGAPPCPPRVVCSWCHGKVCPFLATRIVVNDRELILGHDKCLEEHEATKEYAS